MNKPIFTQTMLHDSPSQQ